MAPAQPVNPAAALAAAAASAVTANTAADVINNAIDNNVSIDFVTARAAARAAATTATTAANYINLNYYADVRDAAYADADYARNAADDIIYDAYVAATDAATAIADTNARNAAYNAADAAYNATDTAKTNALTAAQNALTAADRELVVPLSSTCFPANTLISTNQGNIVIQNLDPKIHTIRNKKIELITKTITQDKYLVCFEKDSLGKNLPSEKTIITKNHLIYYKGSAIIAKDFVNVFENVKKVKYNGEVLYNVLLKEHDKMMVNNLICETLHPDNIIGHLYKDISSMSQIEQQKIIKEYNDYCIKYNTFSKKR